MNCKTESLHEAVQVGNAVLVKELIREGASLEAPNEDGKRPLHLAILHRQEEVLDILIALKCDVNSPVTSRDSLGGTAVRNSPLGLAVEYRNTTAVNALIRAGADVNAANAEVTPLQLCAVLNLTEPARILLDNQVKLDDIRGNQSALHFAASHGCLEMADLLLSRGASVNIKEFNFGFSPLHQAVCSRDLNIVKLLVRHGADVNSKAKYKETPLILCITTNTPEILEFLLANGARINYSEKCLNPIDLILVRSNNVQILKILLKNGLLLNRRMYMNATALRGITSETDKEVIQILLDHNVLFNLADKYRLYPVHYAALVGHVEAVQLLIEKGASVDCCGCNNWTPLHLAAGCRYGSLVQVLLEKGADVNKTDILGRTAFDLALIGLPMFARRGLGPDVVIPKVTQIPKEIAVMNYLSVIKRIKTPNTINGIRVDVITVANILIRNGGRIDLTFFDELFKLGDAVLNSKSFPTSYLRTYTDLFKGIAEKQDSLVKACIEKGAVVDCVVSKLGTPLTYACELGASQVAETILASGANPNLKTENGMTPLHFAALVGDESTVISLLWKGAMYDAQNSSRRKPIHYAKKAKHAFITSLLQNVDNLFQCAKTGDLDILSSLTALKNVYASKRSALGIDKSNCTNKLYLFFVIKNSSGKNLVQVAQANNNSIFVHCMWDALQIK